MEGLSKKTQLKLEELEQWFNSMPGSITAFSGGIDSSLVLYLARKWQGRERAIGVISKSESLKTKDFELARSFSAQYDIHMEVIVTRELEDDRYNENPIDRCFFCKDHLYSDLQSIREIYPGFEVLNGTNVDDQGDYRPGMQAGDEHDVRKPLIEAGFDKTEVRLLAEHWSLPIWDKSATPCLSSRIAYGRAVTAERVQRVDRAEQFLRREFGLQECRVRHEMNDLARIEVPEDAISRLLDPAARQQLAAHLHGLGFKFVSLDLDGFRSGSMNAVIPVESLQKLKP